ncbi:MAG: NUDIX hydrolase [Chelatococcus sp.]|uniref:NUDIX hydrolase n=1 Tax=Chelatococcus sp. TaxID=1953771 RepID=UPI0025C2D916|nr:NUDIX hydrolase [Chelatococcus sp.]MBX3539548.1 NUDIX hydrolase [Chelatococcus sp.]
MTATLPRPAARIVQLDDVDMHLAAGAWPWAVANRARIDANWLRLKAEKPALYNGQVLVMSESRIADRKLTGRYIATDYASFLAMRDFGVPAPGTGNCFAMAALRSADGAYVLGVMGEHTANAGKAYFPAGTPDLADVLPDGRVDLLGSVGRELAEETGLGADDVTVGEGWTAILDGPRLALMRPVQAELPADRLVDRIEDFLATEAEPELAGIRLVRTAGDIDPTAMPFFLQCYLRHVLA